ncbi:MAG: DJ-1/PfpI family protein [Myxococcales bacterium]|jgi:putative intracellular protease/amidase|nr:MAG: DJ-1/PfpI family protein [Myxococcales bacterium]
MQIAFLVYEGMTTLDLIGPYEVLNGIPGADVRFVAKKTGELRVDSKAFGIVVDHALADVPRPDVFVVPGGLEGTFKAAGDEEILGWVREAHAHSQFTTSVCTGSLILGAAGVLEGKNATTHWAAVPMLEQYGCSYSPARVVEDGKVITAAGVSSGIDMGLTLAARLTDDDTARAIQLGIEYDPQPPFDAGSPEKAGQQIVDLAMAALSAQM